MNKRKRKFLLLIIVVMTLCTSSCINIFNLKKDEDETLTIYPPHIDVDRIECTSDDYVVYNPDIASDKEWIDQGYAGNIQIKYTENMRILLKCKIYPANATEQNVQYICDNTNYGTITYNEDGTAYLDILRQGIFDVIIRATDNKGTSIKIKIIVINVINFDDII